MTEPGKGTPLVWLIIGPNGAGKTTYYQHHIQTRFRAPLVNADLLALDRWPNAPDEHAYQASKLAASLRERLLQERRSFVAEVDRRGSENRPIHKGSNRVAQQVFLGPLKLCTLNGYTLLLRHPQRDILKLATNLLELPLQERIQLVEDLWDSIAAEQNAIPLSDAQREELDRRLNAYQADGNKGRTATEVIAEIQHRL